MLMNANLPGSLYDGFGAVAGECLTAARESPKRGFTSFLDPLANLLRHRMIERISRQHVENDATSKRVASGKFNVRFGMYQQGFEHTITITVPDGSGGVRRLVVDEGGHSGGGYRIRILFQFIQPGLHHGAK